MKKQLLLHLLFVSFVFAEWDSKVPLLSDGSQIGTKSTLSKNSPEIAFGDWDNDGDLDLFFFDAYSKTVAVAPYYEFRYFENIGTKNEYKFTERTFLSPISTPYPS